MGQLAGKVAIVTGSTSGMGEAIARRFSREGAFVVVNSSRSTETGESLAKALSDAVYVQADVADEGQSRRLVDAAIERWGRLDILVNNAAVAAMVPHVDLDGLTDEIWWRTLDVNLLGPWRLTRYAVPALRESRSGAVVNVTSLGGTRATEAGSSMAYLVSKAALNHLTLLMANALGPEIRVNALAPGRIETPIWGARRQELLATAASRTVLARAGQPVDIADACLFLASTTYVTGQVLTVDGGMGIKIPQQ